MISCARAKWAKEEAKDTISGNKETKLGEKRGIVLLWFNISTLWMLALKTGNLWSGRRSPLVSNSNSPTEKPALLGYDSYNRNRNGNSSFVVDDILFLLSFNSYHRHYKSSRQVTPTNWLAGRNFISSCRRPLKCSISPRVYTYN